MNYKKSKTISPKFATLLKNKSSSSEIIKKVRNNIFEKLKDFVFYRVDKVILDKNKISETRYYSDISEFKVVDNDSIFTQKEEERYVEKYAYYFKGTTKLYALRSHMNKFNGTPIMFSSKSFSVFDPLKLGFEKSPKNTTTIVPLENELICGLVKKTENGLKFSKWFICSEQFMRAWSMLIYDKFEAIDYNRDPIREKQYYMSGNRLVTNTYLKWIFGEMFHFDKIKEESNEKNEKSSLDNCEKFNDERPKHFYNVRYESCSKKFIHIYAGLVLYIRYEEELNEDTVPLTSGNTKPLPYWHLPSADFLSLFLQEHLSY